MGMHALRAVGPPLHGAPNLGRRIARASARIKGDLPLAALDACLIVAAYTVSLGFRFDFHVPTLYWERFRIFLPAAVAVHLGMNLAFGGYGRAWRHASIDEARRLLVAGLASTVVLLLAFGPSSYVPVSVLVAGALATVLLVGLSRFQSRLFAFRRAGLGTGIRVAVIGAGSEAASALREMQQSPEFGLVPVVVADGDRRVVRRRPDPPRRRGAVAHARAQGRRRRRAHAGAGANPAPLGVVGSRDASLSRHP
jgi:hypothetical protein